MADAHDIQSWLNGDKLRSRKIREQYPLIALIVCLVFIYILMGYQSAKQQHRLNGKRNSYRIVFARCEQLRQGSCQRSKHCTY